MVSPAPVGRIMSMGMVHTRSRPAETGRGARGVVVVVVVVICTTVTIGRGLLVLDSRRGGGSRRRGGHLLGGGQLAVVALQVGQQPEPQGIPLVEALHADEVSAHLGRALAPAYGVVVLDALARVPWIYINSISYEEETNN